MVKKPEVRRPTKAKLAATPRAIPVVKKVTVPKLSKSAGVTKPTKVR